MANLYLDRDAYLQAQKIIGQVDQTLSNTYTRLKNSDFKNLQEEFDYYGEISDALSKFVTTKRRISDLYDAMGDYLAAWDEAQEKARQNAGDVQVVTDRYSDQVFWNLYTDRVLEGDSEKYADSKAWQYVSNGGSFSVQYSDFQAFRWKSGYWPELALWARDIGSWRKSTVKGLDGELYYEPKLNASLEGMLKGLPGYMELDTVNTDIIDWDAMGEKLGIPGLKTLVGKMAKLAGKTGEIMGEEEISEGLQEIVYQWSDNPKLSDALQTILDGAQFLEGTGKLTGKVMKIQEYAEFSLQMILHCVSDHTQQIEYLENAKEALLAAGYDDGGVVSNLSYLQTLYENKDLYVAQKVYDKLMELGVDTVDGAIGKLGVVKWVDLGYGGAGAVANIFAGDKMKAADSMMGIMQYEGALTETFNRYSEMIKAGVATQEDITRADQLFDMICTTKMKGYQDMMTIIGDKTDPGYIMAKTKYEELKEMISPG